MTALAFRGDAVGVRTLAGARAVIYTRVSQDRSGRARSPEEQEESGRRDADRFGLVVADVLRDLVGASRHTAKGKTRDDFARLRVLVESGAVDVVVAWSLDRVTRNKTEWADIEEVCRSHAVLFLLDGRPYDLDDPEDEYQLGLAMLNASREVGILRKRVMRALVANAAEGRPHGLVPWGYRRTYDGRGHFVAQVPDPATAPLVRECFDRVAAGESLRSVTRDLDARGISPRSGEKCPPDCDARNRNGQVHRHRTGEWGEGGPVKLASLLRNRSYLGERTHGGTTTKEDAWEPLVSVETFERVGAVLADPRRMTNGGDTRIKHLLSGLLVCGGCGADAYWHAGSLAQRRKVKVPIYRCQGKGCRSMKAADVEARIEAAVLDRLRDPNLVAAWATDSGADLQAARQEFSTLSARLSDAEDALADGEMSAAAFGRLEQRLAPRIAEASETMRRLAIPVPPVVVAFAEGDVEDAWGRAEIGRKRAAIAALFPTIRLLGRDARPARLALVHPDGRESRI